MDVLQMSYPKDWISILQEVILHCLIEYLPLKIFPNIVLAYHVVSTVEYISFLKGCSYIFHLTDAWGGKYFENCNDNDVDEVNDLLL